MNSFFGDRGGEFAGGVCFNREVQKNMVFCFVEKPEKMILGRGKRKKGFPGKLILKFEESGGAVKGRKSVFLTADR